MRQVAIFVADDHDIVYPRRQRARENRESSHYHHVLTRSQRVMTD